MANSWSNGWNLAKQSGRLLMAEKSLVVFPLLSGAACVAVMLSFLTPLLLLSGVMDNPDALARKFEDSTVLNMALLFAFYFVNFFIITFFNAALSACVIDHLRGGKPTVQTGLRVAASRLSQIVGWAALAATVGMILRTIAERSGLLGRIVISLMGAAWSVTTFFVTPVLVAEQLGPIEATRRSLHLMRESWGTAVVSNASINFVTFLLALAAWIPAVVGIVAFGAAADTSSTGAILALAGGVGFSLVALVVLSLVVSTIRSIQTAVLYEYAANGRTPDGFDPELLQNAFRPKK